MSDFSWQAAQLSEAISSVSNQMQRIFILLRPKVFLDGNQWCCLYGDDIQSGVCGFGDSPDKASWAFEKAWYEENKPKETHR
jgi:hypothetical protein